MAPGGSGRLWVIELMFFLLHWNWGGVGGIENKMLCVRKIMIGFINYCNFW